MNNEFIIMRGEDWLIRGLNDLINHTGLSDGVMVEIGHYAGESTEIFAKSNRFRTIFSIDPWMNGYDDTDGASRSDMGRVASEYYERIKPFTSVQTVVANSTDPRIIDSFEDKSLDLVYIDGDHTYEGVKKDIVNWLPKVKIGGYISGHDYWQGTNIYNAVHEILGSVDTHFSDTSWIKRI